MTVADYADDVQDRLPDEADASRDDIEDDLDELINTYQVGPDEAINTVTNRYYPDDGPSAQQGDSEKVEIADLTEPGMWVTVDVEVTSEWDPDEDKATEQIGLVGDASGQTLYIGFSDNHPQLREGETYRISDAVTSVQDEDDYDPDDVSIQLVDSDNVTTTIESIDDVEQMKTFTTVIAEVKEDGSGLIKRCPEDDCNRKIHEGECSAHGEPADGGENSLAVKAVADDGVSSPKTLYFDEEAVESVTGMTFEEAEDIFQDSYSNEAVVKALKEDLEGHYIEVEASGFGAGWGVETAHKLDEPPVDEDTARNLAERYRNMVEDPEIPDDARHTEASGPRRQNAVRVLASEYQMVDESFSESDDDRAPNFAVLPTGGRANRVVVSGTATEVEDNDDDTFTSVTVVDQSSHSDAVETSSVSAGVGDWDAAFRRELREIDTPEFVTVVGKANVFEFEDDEGETVTGSNIGPEAVQEVAPAERDQWTVEALYHTMDRMEAFLADDDGDIADVRRAKDVYGDDISDLITVVRDTIEHIAPADVAPDLELPDAPDVDAESDDASGDEESGAEQSEGEDADVNESGSDEDPEELGRDIADDA